MMMFFKILGWLIIIALIGLGVISAFITNDYSSLWVAVGVFLTMFIFGLAKCLGMILTEAIKTNQLLEKVVTLLENKSEVGSGE